MGHEIVYCIQCRSRLSGVDFEKGRAFRMGHRVACKSCMPQVLAALAPEEQKAFLEGNRPAPETVAPKPVELAVPPRAPQPPRSKGFLWVVAAAAVALAAVGLFVGMNATGMKKPAGTAPPETPPPANPARLPETPPEDARTRAAALALEKARQFMKANPSDLEGQLAAFSEALRLSENTPHARDAREAHQSVVARRQRALSEEFAAVETQARALLATEEFGKAIALWEETRRRPALSDRASDIDRNIAESRRAATTLFVALKERAGKAREKGGEEEIKQIRDRVARWGLPDLSADFDRHLASAGATGDPVAKPLSAEAREYQSRWRDAAALAGAREFDAAIAGLKSASSRITEAGLRAEASGDIDDLGRVQGLHKELCRLLAEWPREKPLTLEWRTETKERRRITGRALRTDPFRAEVVSAQGGEPVFIEFSDVTAAALGEVFKGRPAETSPLQARSIALLCLLEGDVDAARRTLPEPAPAVPEKYWAYAAEAPAKLPSPSPKEIEARTLFYQAEREFREAKTLGAAVEKYRKLLADFADTRVVKGDLDLITVRTGAGKEYFFWGTDLRGRGSFRYTKREKVEACWTSSADGDPASIADNFVEIEFYALPDTTYRIWAYLGACCTETFTCQVQATDLKGPNPRNPKQIVTAEPGSGTGLLLKPQIGGLKLRHDAHGGPKQPARWEWVAVPLPKVPSPGPKILRLLTDQQGFSVAHVVVSALRQAPPSKQEVEKELKKGPRTILVTEDGLVGCWKFDEGKGTTASDSTVHGSLGVLTNMNAGAAWTEGCPLTGLANPFGLEFDGKDDCVKIENDALLNTLGGQFTFAAWIRPHSTREDWQTVLARQSGSSNQHVFILRLDSRNILDFRFITTQGPGSAIGGPSLPNREWSHVACVFDGSAFKLYVNGTEERSVPSGGTLPGERNPLTIGAGEFDAANGLQCPFDGRIDEVRVYARALGAERLQTLANRAVRK